MDANLAKEIKAQNQLSWNHHPYTKDFLDDLNLQRAKLFEECENLSVSTPTDMEQIRIKLVKSKQIKEIISYAKNIRS